MRGHGIDDLVAASQAAPKFEDAFVQSPGAAKLFVNRIEGATHSIAAWKQRLPAALKFLFGQASAGPP